MLESIKLSPVVLDGDHALHLILVQVKGDKDDSATEFVAKLPSQVGAIDGNKILNRQVMAVAAMKALMERQQGINRGNSLTEHIIGNMSMSKKSKALAPLLKFESLHVLLFALGEEGLNELKQVLEQQKEVIDPVDLAVVDQETPEKLAFASKFYDIPDAEWKAASQRWFVVANRITSRDI